MPLAIGEVVQNRYRIHRLLGEGGMGAVYLAEDGRLPGRWCAIKESRPDARASPPALAALRAQFHNEASTLARLSHPNLPTVSDYFSEGGSEYLVMDYVAGEDLAAVLARQRGPLPEAQVLAWAEQVLAALEYLHSQRPKPVIHRDIKPSNLVLTASGQVKLVDFGLVKLLDPSDPRTATVLEGVGTPEYAPIEQYAAGSGHTGPWSDIYSLGATLYHLLTGVPPPRAFERTLNPQRLQPLRSRNPAISAGTDAVIQKAMALHPDRRYPSASEMREALWPANKPKWGRRLAAVVVVTMLLAGASWLLRGWSDIFDSQAHESADAPPTVSEPIATVAPGPATAAESKVTALQPTSTPVPSATALPPISPPTATVVPPTVDPAQIGRIAFHSERDGNNEIYIMNADGRDVVRLTYHPDNDFFPAMSPDGFQIAFVSERDGNAEIYVMDADGSDQRRLTDDPGEDRLPTWTAHGDAVVFNSDRAGTLDLYAVGLDGLNLGRLTNSPLREGHAAVSPDGRWIAFNAGATEDEWEIYVIPATGGDWRRLTSNSVIDWSPSWSPDGNAMLFLSKRRAGNADVYVMDVDGDNPRAVYTGPGYDWGAVWSPTGDYVAFTSDESGREEVYVVRVDGSDLRRLTDGGGAYPSWSR